MLLVGPLLIAGGWKVGFSLGARRPLPAQELTKEYKAARVPKSLENREAQTGFAGRDSSEGQRTGGHALDLVARFRAATSKPTRFHPRDRHEWQGMLVDVTHLQAYCRSAADCGLALGCMGG